MSENTKVIPNMYGNLTVPRRSGILGLSAAASMTMVPFFLVAIMFLATQRLLLAMLTIGVPLIGFVIGMITRRQGRSIYRRLTLKWMQRRKEQSGKAVYLSGASGHAPDGKTRLPGLLAHSELSEHVGAFDQPFGMIRVSGRGIHHYTVVFEAFPDGDALIDDDRMQRYVAHWGDFLAARSLDENIKGASVVVEAAPDTGLRLNRLIQEQRVEDSPKFSSSVTDAIKAEYSVGSPDVSVKITVTFDGRDVGTGKDRGTADMAEEIGSRLPGIIGGLTTTGAGRVRACGAQEIVDATYLAYDPHAQTAMEEDQMNGGTGLSWEDAGPTFAFDALDRYAHQRAVSASWSVWDKPEGHYTATSMRRALEPMPGVMRKRVTLLFRPIPRSESTAEVEREIHDSTFAGSQKRVSPRAAQRQKAAMKSAEEEAQGAGLTRFGMLVTLTLDNEDRDAADDALRRLRRTVPQMMSNTRLRLRETLGNEAVSFQAGLPLGLVVPEHMMLPEEVRKWV